MHRSARTSVRRTATLVAALVLVPALAAPAVAGSRVVLDARDDVVRVDEGGANPTPAPGSSNADFLTTTFTQTATRVVIKAEFTDLRRTGRRLTGWVDMRDAKHHKTTAGVIATRHDREGTAFLMTNRGRDIACPTRLKVSYSRNTVRVGFPRSCVGDPRFLQFRALSEEVRRTWKHAYLDNALSLGVDKRFWTRRVYVD